MYAQAGISLGVCPANVISVNCQGVEFSNTCLNLVHYSPLPKLLVDYADCLDCLDGAIFLYRSVEASMASWPKLVKIRRHPIRLHSNYNPPVIVHTMIILTQNRSLRLSLSSPVPWKLHYHIRIASRWLDWTGGCHIQTTENLNIVGDWWLSFWYFMFVSL